MKVYERMKVIQQQRHSNSTTYRKDNTIHYGNIIQ